MQRPAEPSRTRQHSTGVSGQFTWFETAGGWRNQFTAGAAFDRSRVGFSQSTELGYLNPDRSVTGVGAFGDGVTGGNVDGEPFDTRVDLDGRIHTFEPLCDRHAVLGKRWNFTLSGRYNRTSIDNQDRINPGGTGIADGRPHVRPVQSGGRRDLQPVRAP